MARHLYGSVADYVITVGADDVATLQPGVTVTCWSAPVGGSQYTDLVETDGVTPITAGELTADTDGSVPAFYGPDGVTLLYYDANGGAGPRRGTAPVDAGDIAASAADDLAVHESDTNPHAVGYSDLTDVAMPLITTMLGEDPFYIGHRGSGLEAPEHTLIAYRNVVAAAEAAGRVPVIEVSTVTTSEGIPVCLHDLTLDRTTDGTGDLNDQVWVQVQQTVRTDDTTLLGPGWQAQPLTPLVDVLDEFMGRAVIFLEPKDNDGYVPVRDLLESRYPDATKWVVYKRFFSNSTHASMKALGYTTWGYVSDSTTATEMDAEEANIDLWGVPKSWDDADITAAVGRGKPVIGFNIHRRSEVARMEGLGVQGMMCSRYTYCTTGGPLLPNGDNFASQVAAPGDIPVDDDNPEWALQFGAENDVYFADPSNQRAAVLGSLALADTDPDTYTISWSMMWPQVPSDGNAQSGLAICKSDDTKYQVLAANATGGYHVVIRGDGRIQLYSHAAGVTSGTQLASATSDTPIAGAWMTFEVDVSPTQIAVRRTDVDPDVEITSGNTDYRGPYFHLTAGTVSDVAETPHWRAISVA